MQSSNPDLPAHAVIVCQCRPHGKLPPARVEAACRLLNEFGIQVWLIHDVCALCSHRDEALVRWASEGGPRRVVACRPRAIRALFQTFHLPIQNLHVVDLTDSEPDSILRNWLGVTATLERPAARTIHETSAGAAASGSGSNDASREPLAWFPVLDYDRCNGCGLCVEFCLFGVYERKERTVSVVAPWNCKPHCPACARICPTAAIVFPKYHEAPYDGSEITDETVARARAQAARHELLGTNLKEALRQRRAAMPRVPPRSLMLDAEGRSPQPPETESRNSHP